MPTPDEIDQTIADLDALLSKIEKGVPAVRAETTPDKKDIKEEVNLEVQRKLADIENEWMLIGLRKKYGRNIIRFLWVYFLFAFLAVSFDGFGWWGFDIPDLVLVAIIGGTAVSVLGVVGTVAAGLFKPPAQPPPAA